MPDGYGGGGEGAGGGSQGMGGGDGGGNNGGSGRDNESAAESNRLAAANQAAANQAAANQAAQSRAAEARAQMDTAPLAALSKVQSTPENQQALADQQTVRSFLANVEADKARALQNPTAVGNLSNPNVGTNVTNAALAAVDSGLNQVNTPIGVGKNVEGGTRDVATLASNIPVASFLGYTGDPGNAAVSYGEAKQLRDLGLGNLTGVNLNNMPGQGLTVGGTSGLTYGQPGQTADSVVAATDAARFAEKVWDVAKNFIPGYGLVQTAADLASGKTTLGNLMVGIGINKFAPALQMSPTDVAAIANGQLGDLFTGQLAKYAIGDVAKTYGPTAGLAAVIGLGESGAMSGLGKMLSPANMNFNSTGKVADAFNTGLQNLGVTMGTGSGGAPTTPSYVGTSQQDAIDRYIGNGISSGSSSGSSSAPAVEQPASGNISSSGSYSGGLPYMSNLGPAGGLYRIGDAGYAPYKQDLAQLKLADDPYTKVSDIGNIPLYNVDVAKMASAPFAAPFDPFMQYAAEGGSIQHFAEGGEVELTPEQLEKREAMQAQAQYYKDREAQSQQADIMSSLKALGSIGTEMAPPKAQLFQLGQVGAHTPPKVLPQLAALLQARGMRLAEGGQPDDQKHPNYDGNPVFRTGGLDGLGGKYVEGKGDGTSDDITAMLADGEYVFSADVVSALGNGSNKAGASVLDKTVQAIRARARSAPPDKLPPDAKSPLEYMQSVKGKKHA